VGVHLRRKDTQCRKSDHRYLSGQRKTARESQRHSEARETPRTRANGNTVNLFGRNVLLFQKLFYHGRKPFGVTAPNVFRFLGQKICFRYERRRTPSPGCV
jgi:hypothetical protein